VVAEKIEDFHLFARRGKYFEDSVSGSEGYLHPGLESAQRPPAISFAVTGLPSGATAVFSPATVPAGSGATNVALTVSVPGSSAQARPEGRPSRGESWPVALELILLPVAGRLRRSSGRLHRLLFIGVIAVASAVSVASLNGYGGGGTKGSGLQTHRPRISP
jgi:hypothetical protein